jgi:hypothetical protein
MISSLSPFVFKFKIAENFNLIISPSQRHPESMFSIVIFIRGVLSAAPAANAVVTRMAIAARMNNFPRDFKGFSFLRI